MGMKPLLTVSNEAKEWLEKSLHGQNYVGIMVRVNTKGCAGGEYEFTPVAEADDVSDCDHTVDNNITIYFPRTDLFKLIGSELILTKDALNTRLDFKNPNEDSRCGCGESVSFQVER
jgi:iron-sulfur cluster assembly protein